MPNANAELGLKFTFRCDALDTLALVARHTYRWPPAVNPVGSLTPQLTGELDMSNLIYDFDLPTLPTDDPAAADVVRGELRLSFDGVAQAAIETAKDATVAAGVRVAQGVAVTGLFTFIDDAGNESEHSVELTGFTAADTIPPPDAVGGLGARLVGEEG